MADEELAHFYDSFVDHQRQAAFNDRHLHLFRRLRRLGLGPRSRVLEVGCGIGAMTLLLSRTVKHGRVLAIDLSEKSIEIARRAVGSNPRVELRVADLTEWHPEGSFDLVALFDVLEHVPLAAHPGVFRHLADALDEDGALAVNIPHPAYQDYLRETQPERLQVVDQSLMADQILTAAYAAGLAVETFDTWTIWQPADYQWMVFRRRHRHRPCQTAIRRPVWLLLMRARLRLQLRSARVKAAYWGRTSY